MAFRRAPAHTADVALRTCSEKWAGFHDAAENSTGVGQGLKDEHCTKHVAATEKPDLPREVLDAIDACMPDYEYLRSFKRTP